MQQVFSCLELFQCKNCSQKLGSQSIVAFAAAKNICVIFRRMAIFRRVPLFRRPFVAPRLAAPGRAGILRAPLVFRLFEPR
jgi:hypothetical protein